MANNRNITAADGVLVLSCPDLLIPATQIQQFAADAAWAMGDTEMAQKVRGVDGRLSFGFVYGEYDFVITLQADSDSDAFFETVTSASLVNQTVYRIEGVLTLNGNKKAFIMNRGGLTTGRVMPDGQRVLQPRTWTIGWEKVLPVPIA